MLDISYIRAHADKVQKNCETRQVNVDIQALLELDTARKNLQQQIDELRARRNRVSKKKPSTEEILQMKSVGEEIKKLELDHARIEESFHTLVLRIPNLTHPDSPIGGETDFVIKDTHLSPKTFDFEPKDHESLLVSRDDIDFERGSKVAGSKFYFTKNNLVRLNQALLAYGMDLAEKHGFTLMETPDLAKDAVVHGAGFNPRGEETQIYSVSNTDLNLIGTAEIAVLGYHSDEVLDLSDGPLKYAALSHCFRTEAGSYGRTSKGLYRVHQFTKLELFVFCAPEDSENLHEELLAIEREICDGLEIPYRVIDIASGDLGGPAYRKYDIEAWMTMNDGYGEITSTSNCTDYQARRMNIKYKNKVGQYEYVHTLNGTAIVTSRFPIAIIENHQNTDGSIYVPQSLRPYLGNKQII